MADSVRHEGVRSLVGLRREPLGEVRAERSDSGEVPGNWAEKQPLSGFGVLDECAEVGDEEHVVDGLGSALE